MYNEVVVDLFYAESRYNFQILNTALHFVTGVHASGMNIWDETYIYKISYKYF